MEINQFIRIYFQWSKQQNMLSGEHGSAYQVYIVQKERPLRALFFIAFKRNFSFYIDPSTATMYTVIKQLMHLSHVLKYKIGGELT